MQPIDEAEQSSALSIARCEGLWRREAGPAEEGAAMKVGVIGAGIAGLACARGLKDSGCEVVLLDKSRGAGGRMSSRRLMTALGEVSFDHGAQYFTAKDPGFRAQVDRWAAGGLAVRWGVGGEDAWVGTPTMNAPIKEMARHQEMRWSARVVQLTRTQAGWSLLVEDGTSLEVDAVVVAIPAEQATVLLDTVAPEVATRARGVRSSPCWTLMLAFAERLPIDTDRLTGQSASPVAWAARNSTKPGRAAIEAWVVQAGPDWSSRHLDTRVSDVSALMIQALSKVIGHPLPPAIAQSTHRWLFGQSGHGGLDAIWDDELRLGVCGDWLIAPRVESAWLSGTRLAGIMARG